MPSEALHVLLSMEPERLEVLWGEFGADDPDEFVAWLHERGYIDRETFLDAEAGGEIRVAGLDTIGLLPEDSISELDSHLESLEGYTTLGPLGRGGVGEVLVVRERDLGRRVALKRLLPHVVGDREVLSRFYREAQITAQLEHPGIPPVYRLEKGGGEIAYTMKLVRGETLKALLRTAADAVEEHGRLPPNLSLAARLRMFVRACEAVFYAHQRGFMHRDLKPSNLMLGRFGEVYVMDWGVARRVDDADDEDVDDDVSIAGYIHGDVTQLGAAIGTPAYMAPEQAEGVPVGPAADQYALGLMLQELVTLKRGRPGAGATALLEDARLAERAPVVPMPGLPPLDAELVAIIDRACAADPEHRYASVDALAVDVQRYLDGEEVQAHPDSVVRWLERRLVAHRHLTLSALVTLAMLFFAVVSINLYQAQQERQAAQRAEDTMTYVLSLSDRQHYALQEDLLDVEGDLRSLAAASRMALELGRPEALGTPLEEAAALPLVARVSVGLVSGEEITLPPRPEPIEVRDEYWFRAAMGQREPVWGPARATESGWVLTISQSLAVRDELAGVAALEIDAGALAELLEPEGMSGVRAAVLLDGDGRVLATTAEWLSIGQIPDDDELVGLARRGLAGKLERNLAGGSELVLAYRIEGLGWTYAVIGDRDSMLPGGG